MGDIEVDTRTESDEEAFDPRTPIRKPSVVKLQKKRASEKHLAAASDYRASAKHMRGGKRSVQFSKQTEEIHILDRNLPPIFARVFRKPEPPEMNDQQPSTSNQSTIQIRPETLSQHLNQQPPTKQPPTAPTQQAPTQQPPTTQPNPQEQQQMLQQMIQQAMQQLMPQLQQEVQRIIQQQQPNQAAASSQNPPPRSPSSSSQGARLLTRASTGTGGGAERTGVNSLQQEMYRALNSSAENIELNTRNQIREELRGLHISQHEDQIQTINARLQHLEGSPGRPRGNDAVTQLERRVRNLPWMEEKKTNQVKAFIRHAEVIHQSITEHEDDVFLALIKDKLAPCIWLRGDHITSAVMWQELKLMLERSIKEDDAHANLKLRIAELRQKAGEDLSEYNKRADKLWDQYEELHGEISAEHRKEGQEAMRNAYEKGLANFRVRQRVRDQPNETLKEAKKMARIFTQREKEDSATKEMTCNFCQRRGHREIDCSTKQKMIDQSNQAATPTSANYCTKCNTMGHTMRSCMVVRPTLQGQSTPNSQRNTWNGNNNANRNTTNNSRNGPFNNNNNGYGGNNGNSNWPENRSNNWSNNSGYNNRGSNSNSTNGRSYSSGYNNNRNTENSSGYRNNYQGNSNRTYQNNGWGNNNSTNVSNQNNGNQSRNNTTSRNEQQQTYRSFPVQVTEQQGNE